MAIEPKSRSMSAEAALRWIGDLDHPFYRDERQRFVWYEASAIGFQLALFLQLTIVPLALIVSESVNVTMLLGAIPAMVTSVVVMGYAAANDAPYVVNREDLRRSRTYLAVVPALLIAIAVARFGFAADAESGASGSDGWWIVGGVALLLGIAVGALASSRAVVATNAPTGPAGQSSPRGSRIDALLRWIGDFDHPFYNDERHRFVWFEASAIGFQMLLILQLAVGGIVLLIGGRGAIDVMLVALGPTLLATVAITGYVHRRGARYFPKRQDLRLSRGLAGVALLLLYVAGMARVAFDAPVGKGSFENGLTSGMSVGFVVGIVGVVFGVWLGGRKQQAAEANIDDDG